MQPGGDIPFHPFRAECLIATDHETSAATWDFSELEAPQSLHVRRRPWLLRLEPATLPVGITVKTQEAVGVDDLYPVGVEDASHGPEFQLVADRDVLPFRMYLGGTAAEGVVQRVPGVPTASVPAQLDEPGPDLIRVCVDRDCHGR